MRVRGTNKALAMTTDCNARYLYLDPKVGGQIAVAKQLEISLPAVVDPWRSPTS